MATCFYINLASNTNIIMNNKPLSCDVNIVKEDYWPQGVVFRKFQERLTTDCAAHIIIKTCQFK